jgi:hypothetical protein
MRNYRRSIVDDIEDLERLNEYLERRSEVKELKKKHKKPEPSSQFRLTFAEGVVVAIICQHLAGPAMQIISHHFGVQ